MSTPHGNQEWLKRSLSAVWHPCTQMKRHEQFPLLPIHHGQGIWLYDHQGKAYLDAVSSWWVNLFGHCNPRINSAIIEQLGKLEHVMLAGFTHEPVIQLSERLIQLAPDGLGHCFYASDGASAIEIALKMSAHFWRNQGKATKTKFISLKDSYHGETLGALSVTDVAIFRDAYSPLIRHSDTMMNPDSRLAEPGETDHDYALRCADALETYLIQHHQELAAFIVEPLVQGAAGMAMYHPIYLSRVCAICEAYEVHLIADEIAVGMGRTGTMLAIDQAEITPDFICLSKGITGGYLPLSVVMTTNRIYSAFYDDSTSRGFLHSHSYTGNPLACSAALATLEIFREDDVIERNRIKSEQLNQIASSLRNHPAIRNFRNRGMIWAFEVHGTNTDFAQRCFALGLHHGLLLRPIGNTIYFMPPYIIKEEDMHLLIDRTLKIIDQLI